MYVIIIFDPCQQNIVKVLTTYYLLVTSFGMTTKRKPGRPSLGDKTKKYNGLRIESNLFAKIKKAKGDMPWEDVMELLLLTLQSNQ